MKFIYFWVTSLLITFGCFLICMVANWQERLSGLPVDGRRAHQAASLWGRSIIRVMPGWNVTVEGRENLPADRQPMVIVANHESMSDIWAMYYLGIQFRWLSKKEVFQIPLVGHAMRWANYVSVERGNRESGVKAMRDSAERLRQKLSMLYFPEGTRAEDGKIKAFKIGAFKLARDEQVPVLPIAIHGAGNLWPKHSWIPGKAHVRIRILPAVPPPPNDDLETYAEVIRGQIIQAHTELI